MKTLGKFMICAVAFAVLATSAPAFAGGYKPSVPDTSCVIAFSKAYPKALLAVVKVAVPGSISIKFDIDASNLKYAAEICFDAKHDYRYGRTRLREGRCYCIKVRCGKVSDPEECPRDRDDHDKS